MRMLQKRRGVCYKGLPVSRYSKDNIILHIYTNYLKSIKFMHTDEKAQVPGQSLKVIMQKDRHS